MVLAHVHRVGAALFDGIVSTLALRVIGVSVVGVLHISKGSLD